MNNNENPTTNPRPYRDMYKALIRCLEDLTDLAHEDQIESLARIASCHAGLWNDLEDDPLRRSYN